MPFVIIGIIGLLVTFFVSPHGSDTITMSAVTVGLLVTSVANIVIGTIQLARKH